MRLQPAVFLDRDGVINQDSDYFVKSWEEFHILPGALEALRLLHEAGCEVYIATNQAGVARGLYSRRTLLDMHLRLRLVVAQAGGRIHGLAYCPHGPEDGCACRKPRPGLLQKLAAKYGLNPRRSVMVGDSDKDLEAGHAVGCRTIFLHTRPPDRAVAHLQRCPVKPDYEARNLLEAVPIILTALQAHRSPAPSWP